jgi:hypothetical protein
VAREISVNICTSRPAVAGVSVASVSAKPARHPKIAPPGRKAGVKQFSGAAMATSFGISGRSLARASIDAQTGAAKQHGGAALYKPGKTIDRYAP